MKVVRNTPEQLVLEYVPWILGALMIVFTLIFVAVGLSLVFSGEFMGLMFILIGGGVGSVMIVVFVERLQVILNRDTNKLRLRRQTVLRYREDVYDLDKLQGAEVQTSSTSKGSTTYRPVLLLSDRGKYDPVPITQIYTSGKGAKRAAKAINAWLGDPDASVSSELF